MTSVEWSSESGTRNQTQIFIVWSEIGHKRDPEYPHKGKYRQWTAFIWGGECPSEQYHASVDAIFDLNETLNTISHILKTSWLPFETGECEQFWAIKKLSTFSFGRPIHRK